MKARSVTAIMTALLLVGCGSTVAPLAGGESSAVASSPADAAAADETGFGLRDCMPSQSITVTSMVEADPSQVPPEGDIEAVLSGTNAPDLASMVDALVPEGLPRADALAEAWIQHESPRALAELSTAGGHAWASIGSLVEGRPFQISFEGEAPDLGAVIDHRVIRAVGLEVTTGIGPDDVLRTAVEAAEAVGLRMLVGSRDGDGTVQIDVIAAPPDLVAAWEAQVPDTRACLVVATPTVACDGDVVAAAHEQANLDRPVLPNERPDAPDPDRADEVRRSYLGLGLDEAEAKAASEHRALRAMVEDGVRLLVTMDMRPGRLNVTLCQDVVVDTLMDGEHTD